MAKKPWRTVPISDETGRFTLQQIEDAVRTVMEQRPGKNEAGGERKTRGRSSGGTKRNSSGPSSPESAS